MMKRPHTKVFLIALLLSAMTTNVFAQQEAQSAETEVEQEGAFVHTVFFWLEDGDSEADRQALYEGLQTLKEISEIQQAYIGVPAPTNRSVIDRSYDYSITFVFEDQEAQDAYQEHPIHEQFVEEYSHLWQRVLVYDAVDPEH